MAKIKSLRARNKGIRRVKVGELIDAEWNPATHSELQEDFLASAVEEVGFVGYPDVFELPDGRLKLCDGHLRKAMLVKRYGAGTEIEVNVTNLDEGEAKKFALSNDPIASMRQQEDGKVSELLAEIDVVNQSFQETLDELVGQPTEDADTVLKQLDTRPPPKMTWCLIGLPTVRWGEIAETIEQLAAVPDIIMETASNDG